MKCFNSPNYSGIIETILSAEHFKKCTELSWVKSFGIQNHTSEESSIVQFFATDQYPLSREICRSLNVAGPLLST